MKKLFFILAFLLNGSFAHADDIDYFLRFANENAALTAFQNFTNRTEWPLDYCLPGIQIWQSSLDNADGSHNYVSGFIVMCSFKRVIPALVNLAQVQIVIDRDLARQRAAGAVIKSNVSNAVLQDLRFSPVVAGSDYPFGNMQ